MKKLALLVACFGFFGCAPTPPAPAPVKLDPPAPAGRTLLALYVIGSDLEDDVDPRNRIPDEQEKGPRSTRGNGSRSLSAIVAALKGLDAVQRANVDVLVGFGGARKQGWNGLRVASAEQLVRDDQDGHFGNQGPFLVDRPELDLGSRAGLEAFLQAARAQAKGSPRLVTVLWDHGGSYAGLGPDTVTGGRLSLSELREALEATAYRTDVIGFDACHMASLEVLGAVADHASYMVASEEIEPADGWDLGDLVRFLAANPAASYPAVGRGIVDAYLAKPGPTRTLSVSDVGHASAVQAGLNDLAHTLEQNWPAAADATTRAALVSRKFGGFGYGNQEVGVDARQWALALVERGWREAASPLAEALGACLVYSREGGGHPGATGLMLASPRNTRLIEAGGYGPQNAATLAYWDLLKGLARQANGAERVPDFTLDEAVPAGRRLRLGAEGGLDEVSAIHAVRLAGGGERYELVERRTLLPEGDGSFTLAAWDGRALVLTVGAEALRAPVTREDALLGRVPLQIGGRPVTLQLAFDAAGEVTGHWLEAVDVADAANLGADRQDAQLAVGTLFSVEEQVLDWDDRTTTTRWSRPILVTAPPTFRREPVAGEAVYFAEAADLLDRFRASAPHAAGRAR
jgi:hypothetical protein